jgi:hypothetical protein
LKLLPDSHPASIIPHQNFIATNAFFISE